MKPQRLVILLFVCTLLLLPTLSALAEMPNPTLDPNANPYDAEHPELLEEDQLNCASAILIEEDSGDVIFEKEADMLLYPASTTKIMTVLLGIKFGNLNDVVTVSANAVTMPDPDATTMGLKEGEEIVLEDLLYGTLMRSGNDGALAIAEHISGSEAAFVDLMNQAAQTFGMTNTHFMNPHGLHDDNHYSTARDLAILARTAMADETFRDIAKTVSYDMPKTNLQRARTIETRHRIMLSVYRKEANRYYYEPITGIKSGSHSRAGYCYVGSATKDGVDLISVVLYSGNYTVWSDTKKLMEYGFSQYEHVTLETLYNSRPIQIETTGFSLDDPQLGTLTLSCIPAVAGKSASITATHAEVERLKQDLRDIVLVQYTRDFTAPITAGEQLGTMTYYDGSPDGIQYKLVASRSIAVREDAPLTLAEIVAMTDADTSIFPPITIELVLVFFSPVAILALILAVLRYLYKRYRKYHHSLPKGKNRYIK